jgi:hypothetical protein
MTISTDSSTSEQAHRRARRPGTARLEAIGVGIALAVALGVLAQLGHSGYGSVHDGDSPYARPTPALHGQTLASYVAAHEARRLTLRG